MTEWADLPEEILDLVLSRLYAKDRHNFRLVCRSWNAAAAASSYDNSRCLMFYQRTKRLWKFFQYNGFFYMSIPELNNAYICCSKCGWLLLCRDDLSLFFFDPFNRRMIELPSEIDEAYSTIHFFNPPTSPDCIIVGIATQAYTEKKGAHIGVLRHGEDEWESYSYHSDDIFWASISAPVLHCGLLYFVDAKGNVATFDISGHGYQFSWNVNTNCLSYRLLRSKINQHFLFKIKGEEALFAVFVIHDDRKVNVFRLLEPDMKWITVNDLGDKTLYLSLTSSFGDTAHLKSLANKICFPTLYGDSILFYSLDTRKIHSFDGDYSKNNCYDLKRLDFATWITPALTPEVSTDLTWYSELDDSKAYDPEAYDLEVSDSNVDDSEEADSKVDYPEEDETEVDDD